MFAPRNRATTVTFAALVTVVTWVVALYFQVTARYCTTVFTTAVTAPADDAPATPMPVAAAVATAAPPASTARREICARSMPMPMSSHPTRIATSPLAARRSFIGAGEARLTKPMGREP